MNDPTDLIVQDTQRALEARRRKVLSCLFDLSGDVQHVLPPPEAQSTLPSSPIDFPNHNPVTLSDQAALQALGRQQRLHPGRALPPRGPQASPDPQTAQVPSAPAPAPQLPTPEQLQQLYPAAPAVKGETSLPSRGQKPRRSLPRRRFTLYAFWRTLVRSVVACPRDALLYPTLFGVGVVARVALASNGLGVLVLLVVSVLLTTAIGLFRSGWRELALSIGLLLGILLAGLFS